MRNWLTAWLAAQRGEAGFRPNVLTTNIAETLTAHSVDIWRAFVTRDLAGRDIDETLNFIQTFGLAEFFVSESDTLSRGIANRIQNTLNQAIIDVESDANAATLTTSGILAVAAGRANTKLAPATRLWSNLATQETSELTRFRFVELRGREALVDVGGPPDTGLPGSRPIDEPIIRLTKSWSSMGDAQVRPAHMRLNGQLRLVDQPFEIDGFRLRFPGDRSMGAPIRMVANCRCSAEYSDSEFITSTPRILNN